MNEYLTDQVEWQRISVDARGDRTVDSTLTIGARVRATSRMRRDAQGENREITATAFTFHAVPVGDRLIVNGEPKDVVTAIRGRDLTGQERFWKLELA